ncbi:MAG TPA: hypothetical protein VEY30_08910, partial [Myxococcaceae bacterium]|nr:hypothetical protein [Myxococcaceae bacterium]
EVVLANDPGGPVRLGYALTQDAEGRRAGEPEGLTGQLRDSDGLVGYDAQTVQVRVTQGSAEVRSVEPGGFRGRARHDVVSGAGLPANVVVVRRTDDDRLSLSIPWPGESGVVALTIHHDLHNYCVHFSLPVP